MIARIFWGGGWNGGRKTRQIASSHSAAQWQSFKADSGGAKVSCNLVALVLGAKSHKFVVLTALVCSVIILWLINFFHSAWKKYFPASSASVLYTYLPRVILFCFLFTKSLNHFDVSQVPCTITYLVKKQIHMVASLKRNYNCNYYL